jgi:PAS domain-containing protein
MTFFPEGLSKIFASPTHLATLLDPLPVGVAVISPQLRILFMNTAMEGLTGFNRSAILGKPCYHACMPWQSVHGTMSGKTSPGGHGEYLS